MTARQLGAAMEQQARDYLQKQGLQLLQQNYHCRRGEIDLIMQHDTALVFVEVRYRRSASHGSALETIDWRKQQRIIMTAQHYLQRYAGNLPVCRFDVVSITESPFHIHWLQDAFQPG